MYIKEASIEDGIGILKVRNHPKIREVSKNKQIISEQEHIKWFKNKLKKNKEDIFLVLKDNNIVIGYLRLDRIDKNLYLISIAILPDYQGQGLGKKLFLEGLNKLKKGDKIIAEILEHNISSEKFFESLGFKLIEKGKYLYKV